MLLILVLWKISFAEGRVYCQDVNAGPWTPIGHPCPVTCSTILAAVERLKITDYQYLLNEKLKNRINMSSSDLYKMGQKLQETNLFGRRNRSPETKRHLKMYNTYHRVLNNEKFVDGLKKELSKVEYDFKNRTCNMDDALGLNTKNYKMLVGNKCFRRLSKRPEVVEKFTRFLNKYADPKYKFDEDMGAVILQKLEGSMNLRYGEVDFKRIVAYLRKALRYHGSRTNDQMIRIQSRNCITIYLSGCFCKHGFVEDRGQCVKPEDCMGNSIYSDYLQRIVIH